jgi:SSS family solute:Na+ symporter
MNLTWLDFLLISIYFVALLVIGYLSARRQSDDDYLIAQRNLGPLSTMATINASKTGSILMVFVALVYVWGFSAIWYFIGTIVGMLVFIPFALCLKENSQERFYTLADYFKYNYGSQVAIFASVLTSFLMLGFLIVNLIAGTKIFVFFTGWPFWLCALIMMSIVLIYIFVGGYRAVVRTDMIQYVIIILLLAVLAIFLGGNSNIPVAEWNFLNMKLINVIGFFIVGIMIPFAMPDLWQRVYSAKDKKSYKRGSYISIVIYAIFSVLMAIVALTIKVKFPGIDPDIALIHGFNYLLPAGLLGFAVILLFAALMSTIDTNIFAASAILVQDFTNTNKSQTVRLLKKVVLILGVLATGVAILVQGLMVSTYIFTAFILVLAIIVLSTWIKKSINPVSLIFAFIVGIVSVIGLLVYYFVFAGGIQPMIALQAIGSTILGLLLGGVYSKFKKDRIVLSGSAIIEDGKLLLLRKIKNNTYEFPGGKVEPGESIEETAIRETKEELSCDVELIRHITAIKFQKEDRYFVSHKFSVKILKGEPQANGIEHDRLLWMPINNYQDYQIAPNVILFCQKYLNNQLKI